MPWTEIDWSENRSLNYTSGYILILLISGHLLNVYTELVCFRGIEEIILRCRKWASIHRSYQDPKSIKFNIEENRGEKAMLRYVFFLFPRVKDHCFSFAQCRQLRLHHTERRICYFKRVKTKTIRWSNNNSTNKVNQNKEKYNTKEQTSYCNFCLPAGMPRDSLSLAFSTEICNKLRTHAVVQRHLVVSTKQFFLIMTLVFFFFVSAQAIGQNDVTLHLFNTQK